MIINYRIIQGHKGTGTVAETNKSGAQANNHDTVGNAYGRDTS